MGTRLAGPAFDQRPETVGTAEATMRLQVCNPLGEPLPRGEIGEVYIWGAGVFRGYWDNPAATSEVLDGERWYRTDDFGRIDGRSSSLRVG